MSLYLCVQKQCTRQVARALEGHCVSLEILQGSVTESRELLGGNREKVFPDKGSLIFYPSGSPNI